MAQAMAFCRTYGAHLAFEETEAEQNYLKGIAQINDDPCFWVGLSDEAVEDRWEWVDGDFKTVANDLYWYAGQPNNFRESNCACLYKSYSYGLCDENCGKTYDFICEIDLASNT